MDRAADKRANDVLTQRMYNEFSGVFSGIGCFEGTFGSQLKGGSQQYQAPPRGIAYTIKKPLKEEPE